MGAAMMIRRDVFGRVGGFDERFFLYWEDADLCRRMREAGFSTRYVPSARVHHAGAASSATAQAFSIRAFHRSAYLYYALHTVPSRLHPARWFAWLALHGRAWWRVRTSRP
jgi:GT2 family glycosyltransferase